MSLTLSAAAVVGNTIPDSDAEEAGVEDMATADNLEIGMGGVKAQMLFSA